MGSLFSRRGVLAGGFLALLFLNVLNSSYSTVLALIKGELGLSYALSGALMSSYFVGYALGQVPWGYLADRVGIRMVMSLSILGAALSTVLFGLSADALQVMASRFLAGLLGAGLFVPAVKLVSIWYSPGERGTALGILNVGGSLGLVLASWLSPVLTVSLGWRGALILWGVLGSFSAALVWLSLGGGENSRRTEGGRDLAGVFGRWSFWGLALMQFIRLGSYYTFIAWLPLFLQEDYGLSLLGAGAAFSLFNVAGMVSNPLGGFVSDRMGERLVILSSFSALALVVLLLAGVRVSPAVYVAVLALGWFINFVRSPIFAVLPKLYGPSLAGRVSGIQNTFASVGALVLPFVLGYVRDVTASYLPGWAALSGLLALGALLSLSMRDA